MDYMDDSQPDGEQGSAQGAADQATDSGKTTLINSSICPGMKVGDTFEVKVEKVLDSGEYEVSYPGGSSDNSDSSEGEPSSEGDMGSAPQSEAAAYMS